MRINKIVRIGCMKDTGDTFCKITFDVNGRLSITGVEGPLSSGNARGGCGQIDLHEWGVKTYAPGWNAALVSKFRAIWAEWHLNDMQSACEHQRELGWTYKEHSHPVTFQGEPCPVCGYKIGSRWLKKEVPADVLEFLASLPDTDKTPAWL